MSQKDDFELIYDRLVIQFNGRQVITLPQAGEVLGYAKSSCPSMFCRGSFPVAPVKIGAKPAVRLLDLARYLAAPIPHITPPPSPFTPPRPRGRPSGTSIAAQYAKRNAAAPATVKGGVQ